MYVVPGLSGYQGLSMRRTKFVCAARGVRLSADPHATPKSAATALIARTDRNDFAGRSVNADLPVTNVDHVDDGAVDAFEIDLSQPPGGGVLSRRHGRRERDRRL